MLESILIGILLMCLLGAGLCFFMLFRNDWVYSARVRILDYDYSNYKNLPSYDTMLWKFWIWDIKKFLPKE